MPKQKSKFEISNAMMLAAQSLVSTANAMMLAMTPAVDFKNGNLIPLHELKVSRNIQNNLGTFLASLEKFADEYRFNSGSLKKEVFAFQTAISRTKVASKLIELIQANMKSIIDFTNREMFKKNLPLKIKLGYTNESLKVDEFPEYFIEMSGE